MFVMLFVISTSHFYCLSLLSLFVHKHLLSPTPYPTMPVQMSNFHKDPVVLRIVAAIVTQQREAGTSVSCSYQHASKLLRATHTHSDCLLLVAPCCQSKALWVESARTLASTYNVGIARDAIKTHQAAVEVEVSKHEDLSTASWTT